jgi:hypothetical protein
VIDWDQIEATRVTRRLFDRFPRIFRIWLSSRPTGFPLRMKFLSPQRCKPALRVRGDAVRCGDFINYKIMANDVLSHLGSELDGSARFETPKGGTMLTAAHRTGNYARNIGFPDETGYFLRRGDFATISCRKKSAKNCERVCLSLQSAGVKKEKDKM